MEYINEMFASTNVILLFIIGILAFILIINCIVFCIMQYYGLYKIFKKADYKGWYCLIPIYNLYIICKITGVKTMWFFIYLVLSFVGILIPIIGPFITLFVTLYFAIEVYASLAKTFHKNGWFAAGLILFPAIFFFILGVDASKYRGPKPINDGLGDFLVGVFTNNGDAAFNEETMVKCGDCGYPQDKGHKFCYKCGKKLKDD